MWIKKLAKLLILFLLVMGFLHVLSGYIPSNDYEYATPHTSKVSLWWKNIFLTANAEELPVCDCTECKPFVTCLVQCTSWKCKTTGNTNKKCKTLPYETRAPCEGCLRCEGESCTEAPSGPAPR